MAATSSKGTANRSCSTKARRSAGVSASSTTSSAGPMASAKTASSSGLGAATGEPSAAAGTARAAARERDRSTSRQTRDVIVVSHPSTLSTSTVPARLARSHASCTASSASALDPSMRVAMACKRPRLASNRSVSVSSVMSHPSARRRHADDVRWSGDVTTAGGTMEPRMDHPAYTVPGAMDAMQALGAAVGEAGLNPILVELLCLRASQINGCSVCVDGHPRIARKLGETDERLFAVSAWREAPYFNAAERAALALTDAVTRLADRDDPVPDHVWSAAAVHYDDKQLAGLVLAIANINVWNRLNAATRQVAGNWQP